MITSAYFVPPESFKKALIDAAARGVQVQVQVLTSGQTDFFIAREAGRNLYSDLLNGGIRIFEMQQPALHAKYLTIDGGYSSVGSYNIDHWSKKHNREANISVEGAAVAEGLGNHLRKSLRQSREIDLREWRKRPLLEKFRQWAFFHLSGMR